MAKRFTDTGKWKKGLLKSLAPRYKLLWLYIIDECDHAGIWQVEWEVMELRLGLKIDRDEAITALSGKIQVFDGGEKWFISDFIQFQYGKLNPENKVHKSIINLLTNYQSKGLTSPLQGAKDKDKDKETAKEQEKEGGLGETKQDDYVPDLNDYQQWTNDAIDGRDHVFEAMMMNEIPQMPPEILVAAAKNHLVLISRYDWKFGNQQKFRNSLLGSVKEYDQKNGNKHTGFKSKQERVSEHNADQLRRVLDGTL